MSIVLIYCFIYALAREYIASRIKLVGTTLSQWHKAFALTAGLGIVGVCGVMLSPSGWLFVVSWQSILLMIALISVGMVRKMSAIHVFRATDRSSCTMFEIGMLPLLFGLQWIRGMDLGMREVSGMLVIETIVIVVFVSRIVSLQGLRHLLIDGICMIIYSIIAYHLLQYATNPYTLQTIQAIGQLAIIAIIIATRSHESWLPMVQDRRLIQLALMSGVVQYCYYSALSYSDPSIVTATNLSISLVVALLAGRKLFGESAIIPKLGSACVILLGVGCIYVPLLHIFGT